MSGKEQFIKLPREVLESAAFGSLGINAFRVVRFLMIEHMRRGGRQNGTLKAPHRQLVAFGIAPRHVTAAICEVEESHLIRCHRHGLRVATTYELTWLPLHDGSAPSDAWREYQRQRRNRKRPEKLPTESEAGLPTEGGADGPKLPTEGKAEPSANLPTEGKALYRNSYQGGDNGKVVEGELLQEQVRAEPVGVQSAPAGKPEAPAARCGWYVTDPNGFRICGKPVVDDGEHCAEHARPPTPAHPASGKPNGQAAL
jgi:hypothetical protein